MTHIHDVQFNLQMVTQVTTFSWNDVKFVKQEGKTYMAIVILSTLFSHIWQKNTIAHNCTSMCIFYDHIYWRFAWNSINLDIFPLLQLKLMTHKFVLLSYLVLNTLKIFRMLAVCYLHNWAFILFFSRHWMTLSELHNWTCMQQYDIDAISMTKLS